MQDDYFLTCDYNKIVLDKVSDFINQITPRLVYHQVFTARNLNLHRAEQRAHAPTVAPFSITFTIFIK